MALELRVPSVGESVTEAEIGEWLKQEGDAIGKDENVVVIETDKATVEIVAPTAGRLTQILKPRGTRVTVGEVVGYMEAGAAGATSAPPATPAPRETAPPAAPKPPAAASVPPGAPPPAASAEPRVMPAAARLMVEHDVPASAVKATGPGGRVLKEDVERATRAQSAQPAPASSSPPVSPGAPAVPAEPAPVKPAPDAGPAGLLEREEEVVPMSLLRRKIAQRLVQANRDSALLTTFNEIDMSEVIALRKQFQEAFQKRHQVKLGFMAFFVRASIEALREVPELNAEIRGTDIVYRNYHDIGIAIGGGRGLVVPVLRDAGQMSFAQIEVAIADFAERSKNNTLRPEDLVGGTFTITNGGIYGSLLSTPIVNFPQSGVLGMHAIQDRPVAVNGQVVIRPMMYVALTYDHRVVDGREAVTCLRRIKEFIEQPARLLIEA